MPTAKTPKLELVDIDSLEAHSENPNQGDVGAIVDLIVHNGWFGQTLVQTRDDQPDRIFVGEHRWRALRLLQSQGGVVRENGSETPLDYAALTARAEALDLPTLPPAGKCWVQRYAISDRLARRHMLADNRAHDLASYDDQQLAQILREIADEDGLVGTGFDDEALDELLRDLAADEAKNRPKASDEVPAKPTTPITKRGDLIVLGEHRLLCGDARERSDYDRVLTDLEGDVGIEEVEELWKLSFGVLYDLLPGGMPYYVFGPQGGDLGLLLLLRDSGLAPRHILIWVKNRPSFSIGRLDYDYQHEPIVYGWRPGAAHTWYAEETRTSVLHFDRPQASPDHPTTKPVDLFAHLILNSTQPGEMVLDPFAGSGTALMACEQEGRRARCIEIDPGYCDVIVARWEKHTGRQAERP